MKTRFLMTAALTGALLCSVSCKDDAKNEAAAEVENAAINAAAATNDDENLVEAFYDRVDAAAEVIATVDAGNAVNKMAELRKLMKEARGYKDAFAAMGGKIVVSDEAQKTHLENLRKSSTDRFNTALTTMDELEATDELVKFNDVVNEFIALIKEFKSIR